MGDKLAGNQNGESDITRHAPSQDTGPNLAEKGKRSKSQSTFRSKGSDSEQVPSSQAVSKDTANPPNSADGQAESPPKPSETEESGALSSEPIAVPVVGIGASAGGLEALQSLFENMPESTGLSYIIVQHISPTGKSALAPLLRRYTRMPVDKNGQVVYTRGRTGDILELKEGIVNLQLTNLVREGLKVDLKSGLQQAIDQNKEVTVKAIPVQTNGDSITVDLTILPITEPDNLRHLVVVIFERISSPKRADTARTASSKKSPAARKASDRKIEELQAEIKATKERLQTTIEELETSNEELKSTNEELQSSNEELQSSNEELETSKEELQSANEELLTVNAEHQEKIQKLTQLNDDMANLLMATGIATVFLDEELRTKRFTPQTHRLIRLIDADIGRPITQIASTLDYPDLADDAQDALNTLKTHEKEVQTVNGDWILVRIMPYRTTDNVIEGIIITFNDISDRKAIEDALEQARAENQRLRERLKGL